MIVWYAGAIVLGAIIAFITVSIFRRFAPTGVTRDYWSGVGKDIHGLLYGDEGKFWTHYSNIIRQTAKYIGQQLLAVGLAFAPLIIAFIVTSPWIFAQWDRSGTLTIVPQDAGSLQVTRSPLDADKIDRLVVELPSGSEIPVPANVGSVAICASGRIACFVLQGFGFTSISVDPQYESEVDLIIVRTWHDDWNPLWPYLSDPEFLFFLSLSLGSILFFVLNGKTSESGQREFSINFVDYVLTLFATRNMKFMRKVGDLETKFNAKRLADTPISKPIFIAGLARAGTTILLEKISSETGVATHQYRDFPFIMTPILWNRFLRLFGGKQNPSERPHQDKIKITRDSPEAFEEPIWQHFFPFLHDPSHLQALGTETSNAEFSSFYSQHIQKILLLRGGTRYLSKGNYNVSRIEYIASLFPDSLFLIPIRHPLPHIESLARQHELFCKYSDSDPKIPNYLRAVGHYEFGPQRSPIHLTESGINEIEAAWERDDDMLGYAIQWREVYGHVAEIFAERPDLAERLRIVRFEDLCRDPLAEFHGILDFTGLGADGSAEKLAHGIEASSHRCKMSHAGRDQCWKAVEDTARMYGYSDSLEDISSFSGIPVRR